MRSNSTNSVRVCVICATSKPIGQFCGTRFRGSPELRWWRICKVCRSDKIKAWRKTPSGQRTIKNGKCRRYGITADDYDRMFKAQRGKCAICKASKLPVDPRTKKPYELAIDHCHKTRRVRKLLCHHCNVGLGAFRDDPALLHAAISYLNKSI